MAMLKKSLRKRKRQEPVCVPQQYASMMTTPGSTPSGETYKLKNLLKPGAAPASPSTYNKHLASAVPTPTTKSYRKAYELIKNTRKPRSLNVP